VQREIGIGGSRGAGIVLAILDYCRGAQKRRQDAGATIKERNRAARTGFTPSRTQVTSAGCPLASADRLS